MQYFKGYDIRLTLAVTELGPAAPSTSISP